MLCFKFMLDLFFKLKPVYFLRSIVSDYGNVSNAPFKPKLKLKSLSCFLKSCELIFGNYKNSTNESTI